MDFCEMRKAVLWEDWFVSADRMGWAGGRQVLERLGWEVARATDME